MKMTTEEKAKAYDGNYKVYTELINRLEDVKEAIKKQNYGIAMDILFKPYPEFQVTTHSKLAESEDEEVRKALYEYFKNRKDDGDIDETWYGISYDKILAWLEKRGEHAKFCDSIQVGDKVTRNQDGVLVNLSQLKRVAKKQGEQKPANTPKFKIGDWVIDKQGIVHQIANVIENVTCHTYGYDIVGGGYFNDNTEGVRLWTIQDAKDGDVLVASDGSIFLFKGTIDCACKHYVALTTDNVVKFNEGLEHYWETSTAVHPATKKQHDQLEKAMANAGYTFDFDKKELKKIEGTTAWSEEDEKQARQIERIVHDDGCTQKLQTQIADWFKSLKERVQPKQEWSEEDEYCRHQLIVFCENCMVQDAGAKRCAHWLKSLRPQNWKPSKEQMNTLEYYMHTLVCNEYKEILFGLYEDLKKLMEE